MIEIDINNPIHKRFILLRAKDKYRSIDKKKSDETVRLILSLLGGHEVVSESEYRKYIKD